MHGAHHTKPPNPPTHGGKLPTGGGYIQYCCTSQEGEGNTIHTCYSHTISWSNHYLYTFIATHGKEGGSPWTDAYHTIVLSKKRAQSLLQNWADAVQVAQSTAFVHSSYLVEGPLQLLHLPLCFFKRRRTSPSMGTARKLDRLDTWMTPWTDSFD